MNIFWSLIMMMTITLVQPAGGWGAETIKLPPPARKGTLSVPEAFAARRTVRGFANRPLSREQISQLLWGADGASDPRGHRTSPSAGATYPLDLYLVVGERGAPDLAPGVYQCLVAEHALQPVAPGDVRAAVVRACLNQTWMAAAPVLVVIAGEYRRCTGRYGQRGVRYTHMEAGNVSQNLFLAAEDLGLGAGIVGAFEDEALARALKLPPGREPLLVMPVGYRH